MQNLASLTRRALMMGVASSTTAVGLGIVGSAETLLGQDKLRRHAGACEGEALGQGEFRYRADRHWGQLDRARYPVKDCHGMTEDKNGKIILLTNDIRNNLIAYNKRGQFERAWENRFPTAHGLEIEDHHGEERYWITDHDVQSLSVNTADGHQLWRVGADAVASKYPNIKNYHPTNTAFTPDGDFFISDGYGSSFVHHFDPHARYISSFGGVGESPANLNEPHSVWIDTRSGKPAVLVCDRGNEMLKWFSTEGELQRIVPVPGARPSNVAQFHSSPEGHPNRHIAIASLNGMILILDEKDRVVSAVGGEPPLYVDGKLQPLQVFNYTFNHPHDVYVDASGALYVPQWWSNQTYPIKLELLRENPTAPKGGL